MVGIEVVYVFFVGKQREEGKGIVGLVRCLVFLKFCDLSWLGNAFKVYYQMIRIWRVGLI